MSKPDMKLLSQCTVLDLQGAAKPIAEFWAEQPAILVFLRHFGCIECHAQAKRIWTDHTKYESRGAKIVFIGNGQPHFIQMYKEDLGITDAPIYTDPSLKSFEAAGLNN